MNESYTVLISPRICERHLPSMLFAVQLSTYKSTLSRLFAGLIFVVAVYILYRN